MKKLFQDHDGQVLLHRDAREVRVTRGEFQMKFPDYQLPSGAATRYWDGTRHHLFSTTGDQSIATDITYQQFEEYLSAIPYFKKQVKEDYLPEMPIPDQPAAESGPNWAALEAALVGTPVWDKMLAAMNATTRCNTAGTLILTAFALKNQVILSEGFSALLEAMESSKTAPSFSEEDLGLINSALLDSGFNGLSQPTTI